LSSAPHRRARAIASAAIALLGATCALGASPSVLPDPPLWSVREARFVDERTLDDALRRARFRFIGEVHDNAAQHALRARLVAKLADARPAAVMEIFDLGHDADIATAQANGADAESLATAGGLDRAAWRWPLHRPIVEAAIAAQMPIHGANVARGELMALARSRSAGAWQRRIAAAPWGTPEDAAMRQTIVESHCGALPDDAIPAIAFAQRIRDAAMAEAVASAARETGGAVLLAGNGHVRRDIGAPRYLQPAEIPAGAADIVSVAFVEATAEDMRSPDFPRRLVVEQAAYDYLWFTPEAARPDPCETLKNRPTRPR
jgi:uncharacterized iron-regulated protein